MQALVTGASSGIGRDMAKYLSEKGYDLILVARDEEKMKELATNLKTKSKIYSIDLRKKENVLSFCSQIEDEDIDIFINNAGFGIFGNFTETDVNRELDLIGTNITALHVLTKWALKKMKEKNSGYILNVSSIASFAPGPLMATYYASKAYVTYLSRAISKELKKSKSNVVISCLCPGPVDTNFNNVAGVNFSIKPLSSAYVAKYGIDNLLKRKQVIIPGALNKCLHVLTKITPTKICMESIYRNQTNKIKN